MRYNIKFDKAFATKKKDDIMKNVDPALARHLVNINVATITEKVGAKHEKITETVASNDAVNKPVKVPKEKVDKK